MINRHKEIEDLFNKAGVNVDTISRKGNIFTARRSYFYTHGMDQDKLADAILKAIPNAKIIDKWNKWKAFRGGDTVAQGSHWGVKFEVAGWGK